MVDRVGEETSESAVMYHLSIPFKKKGKKGCSGWRMAALTAEEQSGAIPKELESKNDYFLAKRYWLHLNHSDM